MNRTIVGVLLVLVLCAVALGFYRGWFALSSPSAGPDSNKVNINLTLDPDKAKEDAEGLKNKTNNLSGSSTK